MPRMAPQPKKRGGDRSIIVISVPHSGSRTLVQHLGAFTHTHFHRHLSLRKPDHVHVAIRHPMSVARSWAERGKQFSSLLSAYREMFKFLDTWQHGYELCPVEGLSGRLGADDPKPTRGFGVEKYQAELRERVVEPNLEFFKRFYEDPLEEP